MRGKGMLAERHLGTVTQRAHKLTEFHGQPALLLLLRCFGVKGRDRECSVVVLCAHPREKVVVVFLAWGCIAKFDILGDRQV